VKSVFRCVHQTRDVLILFKPPLTAVVQIVGGGAHAHICFSF